MCYCTVCWLILVLFWIDHSPLWQCSHITVYLMCSHLSSWLRSPPHEQSAHCISTVISQRHSLLLTLLSVWPIRLCYESPKCRNIHLYHKFLAKVFILCIILQLQYSVYFIFVINYQKIVNTGPFNKLDYWKVTFIQKLYHLIKHYMEMNIWNLYFY